MLFTDPTGHNLHLDHPPKRIISLVPSLTETLADWNLHEEVVGITRFCIHPRNWFLEKTRVGGTKDFKLDRIRRLNPDLIIANKEENTKEAIEELRKLYPVWTSSIDTVEDALEQLRELGSICGRTQEGEALSQNIRSEWMKIKGIGQGKKVLYFIWKNPWMVAGRQTFMDDVLRFIGLENICAEERYPAIEMNHFDKRKPDYLFFSTEPYPFKKQDVQEWKDMFQNSKALVVDGEAFSWYGSRMLKMVEEIKQLLQ